jgi:hypothetical protein
MKIIANEYDTVTLRVSSVDGKSCYTLINHDRNEDNIFKASKCELYFTGKKVIIRGKIYLKDDCFKVLGDAQFDSSQRTAMDSLLDYNNEQRWN